MATFSITQTLKETSLEVLLLFDTPSVILMFYSVDFPCSALEDDKKPCLGRVKYVKFSPKSTVGTLKLN